MNGVVLNIRLLSAIVLGLALSLAAVAQDAPDAAPSSGQAPADASAPGGGQHRIPFGKNGLLGTVIAVAADNYTIKTDAGDIYTVHFSANTRILKQRIQRRHPGENGEDGNPQPQEPQTLQPQILQPSDIKLGDTIVALGDVEPASKSVGAMVVLLVDPERARLMHDVEANYGKTWLLGQVTAIDGTSVTLLGRIDNAAHTFITSENTRFRKRRQPIAPTDLQVGDRVRVEGAVENGAFVASSVSVFGPPPGGTSTLPRNAPSAPTPQHE